MADDLMTMGLEPFNPKKHKAVDVGRGGPSTELLATEYAPDGSVWNIPTLWWDKEGRPVVIDRPDDAMRVADEYERATGTKFPRFKSIDHGIEAAKKRSKKGGGGSGFLAAPIE
jgi:hypothetical protein